MLIKYFSITILLLLLMSVHTPIGSASLILELSWEDQSDDVQTPSGLSGSYIDIKSFDFILLQETNTLQLIIGFYNLKFFNDFSFSIYIQSEELIDSGSDWQEMQISQLTLEGNHSLHPPSENPEWKFGTQRNNNTGEFPDLRTEIVEHSSIRAGQGVYNMSLYLLPVFSYSHFEYEESITYSLDLRVSQTIIDIDYSNAVYSDTLSGDIQLSTTAATQDSSFLPSSMFAGLVLITAVSIKKKKR